MRPFGYLFERPLDVHAGGDAADVAKAHRGARIVYRHLRQPPGGPADDTKRAPCRHLDDAAAIRGAIAKANPPIVGQMRGPVLDIANERENRAHRSAYDALVERFHRSSARHRRQGQRLHHFNLSS
jgi:hypothetical protein